jgi:hypothetical protein
VTGGSPPVKQSVLRLFRPPTTDVLVAGGTDWHVSQQEERFMSIAGNLFIYSSQKTKDIFCYAGDSKGTQLPEALQPWKALGVLRADQTPPHGMSRAAIEAGVAEKGYQLWRKTLPVKSTVKR